MSGGYVAYNQRPNKAVDRHLFIDMLGRLRTSVPIDQYTYIGFGGPFLEDFRLAHSMLGIQKMISLELDANIVKRQEFNRPASCISFLHKGSGEFIDQFSSPGNVIVWLDYASPRELREQLQEFQSLLTKLQIFDIVKITVNANIRTLINAQGVEQSSLAKPRLAELRKRIEDFLPNEVDEAWMTKERYPIVLFKAIERASQLALRESKGVCYLPLTAFYYADSEHTMLTVSGVVVEISMIDSFLKSSGLNSWSHSLSTTQRPVQIIAPNLSLRERMFIDAKLPSMSDSAILKSLKFDIGEDNEKSKQMLSSYISFYRHLPHFTRFHP